MLKKLTGYNKTVIQFTLVIIYMFSFSSLFGQHKIKSIEHVEWSKNLSIYEVNLRQYSQEGTFAAFENSLPKLKEMNIGILWFMPINPIGELNRKGSLGSYYSVKDYKAVNPEFGTVDDFKTLVKEAHKLGMYVIIDWVANHTSWDNVWAKSNPEFFTKDKDGKFVSPYDWTDVMDLNYDNKDLWNAMLDAMKYWVQECDIDGFRCDVAAMVPLEFWKFAIPEINKIKKVFMLAEASEPELHQVFDMTYSWQLKDLFVSVGKKEKFAKDFYSFFKKDAKEYPADAYRMLFTTNHDENTWNGTDKERYGDAAEMFSVLTGVVPGMPLVYSGQEAGLNKRLLFFEKDPIEWKECYLREVYTSLFNLKKENKALWNGLRGGNLIPLSADNKNIFAFTRSKEDNQIIAVFNISPNPVSTQISNKLLSGNFKDLFKSNKSIQLNNKLDLQLNGWGYKIFYK